MLNNFLENDMEIKTNELAGAALDWAVAKCEGCSEKLLNNAGMWLHIRQQGAFRFSTEWAHGGPIIEREEITVCWQGATWVGSKFNIRVTGEYEFHQTGPTPLIAAMRCYVVSKMGDTVEIPDELC